MKLGLVSFYLTLKKIESIFITKYQTGEKASKSWRPFFQIMQLIFDSNALSVGTVRMLGATNNPQQLYQNIGIYIFHFHDKVGTINYQFSIICYDRQNIFQFGCVLLKKLLKILLHFQQVFIDALNSIRISSKFSFLFFLFFFPT